MKALYNEGELKELTIEAAQALKGKRIKTLYFGYAGQDGVDDFVVGNIISEYDYYLNCPSETEGRFPDEKGNKNLIDYWKSCGYSDTMIRVDTNDGNIFTCSDADRIVYYTEA